MLKKVASVSVVAALMVLGGCSETKMVSPKTTQPTGSMADLTSAIENTTSGKGALFSSYESLTGINRNALIEATDIHIGGGESSASSKTTLGSGVTQNPPSCINDGITVSEDESSFRGTFSFNNCDFDGVKINGSVTVDYSSSHSETSNSAEYEASAQIDFEAADVKIHVSDAQTNGSESGTFSESENSGEASGERSNNSGISAYLSVNEKKLLILDGMNATYTETWAESWSEHENTHTKSYTFEVDGFIGSDAAGMFEVKTPTKVEGDDEHKCPTKGKITITDRDGNEFAVESDGSKVTTSDGEDYNCTRDNSGSEEDEEEEE